MSPLNPRLAFSLFTLASATLALPAHADGVSGASVDSYFYGTFQINCTTCGHYEVPLTVLGGAATADGGPGAASAAIDFAAQGQRGVIPLEYTVAGGLSAAAAASFEGSLALPVLKARAHADNEQVFNTVTGQPVGADTYQLAANASTVRQYTYIGAAAATYTFNFAVDGSVSNSLASVFASAAIYANASTGFETGLIDSGYASVEGSGINGPVLAFDEAFSVTVEVAPGGSFYLLGKLGASAGNNIFYSGDVSANAYDTMRVTSITGDTSLLVAGAVPEPSTYASLALGLVALGWLGRRRRPRA